MELDQPKQGFNEVCADLVKVFLILGLVGSYSGSTKAFTRFLAGLETSA